MERSTQARRRRARVSTVAIALAALLGIADALIGDAPGAWTSVGRFVLGVGVLLSVGGLATAFRAAWHPRLRPLIVAALEWFEGLVRRIRPGAGTRTPVPGRLRHGERVALLVGLVLAALDVMLTVLLLRDVFPTAPYQFDLFGLAGPELQRWTFYLGVAGFKTGLALWFGIFDASRGQGGALRWFVLGSASAFDGTLAAARGLMLAEQGLSGGPILVSNVLFIGFGVVVPWVVAYTGGLLAAALDPWLARHSLLGLLFALPRILAVGLAWLVALAVGCVVGPVLAICGLVTAIWFALEDMAGVLLGHPDAAPPGDAIADDGTMDDRRDPGTPAAGRDAVVRRLATAPEAP